MPNLWFDLETYSTAPIKNGTHAYAEKAEIMLWAYALDDGPISVWDLTTEKDCPAELAAAIRDPEFLVLGHNAGMFDFVVIDKVAPEFGDLITKERRRDTMVQALCHALPGSLDKLGVLLGIEESDKKLKTGKELVRLFCMPQNEKFVKKFKTDRATKKTHPKEWQEFVEYAAVDIQAMRAVHRKIPMWNYHSKQIDMWHLDLKINSRGFLVDTELARAALRATDAAKLNFAARAREITEGELESTTQRDATLKYILGAHGVSLPDLQSSTIERRLADENLPEIVKELLRLRLVASMNSVSKYKALLNGVSSDGRLRGCAQFRGASRTGRYAHRLFQPGNLPRPTVPKQIINAGIVAAKADCLDLVTNQTMQWASSAIRGCIIAPPGKKLVVADLANIEGRYAVWLTGEEWKLQAFRDFDNGIGDDLYILAYAKSFNVDPKTVNKDSPERQIGKVQELMFQYGGGVGAWITGAATYGIDLQKMAIDVYPTLPVWAIDEARGYLDWVYSKLKKEHTEEDRLKKRLGLDEHTFVVCDAIKRLWRTANPRTSTYWKELENDVKYAIQNPGQTIQSRKIKVRRDGNWLRLGLPSGRALCYPNPEVNSETGGITYLGLNQYSRKWERIKTYGGKLFENITQAVAADQLMECFQLIEDQGYEVIMHCHDETIVEAPEDVFCAAEQLSALMCSDLGWNVGVPLEAKGFETDRYQK